MIILTNEVNKSFDHRKPKHSKHLTYLHLFILILQKHFPFIEKEKRLKITNNVKYVHWSNLFFVIKLNNMFISFSFYQLNASLGENGFSAVQKQTIEIPFTMYR